MNAHERNAHEPHVPDPNPSGQDETATPSQSVPIDPESLARHYEVEDINYRAILWFGGAILAGVVVVNLLLYWLIGSWSGEATPLQVQIPPALVTPLPVPGPGLDAAPEARLNATLAREEQRLNNYAWLDREGGVVRIPVERAMELLVEQGLPAREADAPDFGLRPAYRMDGSGGLRPVGGELEVVAAGTGNASDESPQEERAGGGDADDGVDGDGVDGDGEPTEEEGTGEPGASRDESAGQSADEPAGEVTNETLPDGERTNNPITEDESGDADE